ncbi:MAG: glycosyltransferase family 9 protein [Acidimicrobiales bacterium]
MRRLRLIRDGGEGRPQRILVARLGDPGLTVQAAPALRRAVELAGRDNVYVAVDVVDRFVVDELRIIPPENVIELRSGSNGEIWRDVRAAARIARKAKVDAAVDLSFSSHRSAALVAMSGARRRAGLHSPKGTGPQRGDLMTHRVAPNPVLHASLAFLAIVDVLSEAPEDLPAIDRPPAPLVPAPLALPSPVESAQVEDIASHILRHRRDPLVMLIDPNMGDAVGLRRWPDDRYVELTRKLLTHFKDLVVLVTGTPPEAQHAEDLARLVGSDRCASVAGKLSVRQQLALYHRADVLVTHNSVAAHLAGLTPIDVVTLFGPESPEAFGVVGERAHGIWAGIPCSPCMHAANDRRTSCADNACMRHVEVPVVVHQVRAILERRAQAAMSGPPAAFAAPAGTPGPATFSPWA